MVWCGAVRCGAVRGVWCVVCGVWCVSVCVCEEDEDTHGSCTHTSCHVVMVHMSLFMLLSTCLCRGCCRGRYRNVVVSSCVLVAL